MDTNETKGSLLMGGFLKTTGIIMALTIPGHWAWFAAPVFVIGGLFSVMGLFSLCDELDATTAFLMQNDEVLP